MPGMNPGFAAYLAKKKAGGSSTSSKSDVENAADKKMPGDAKEDAADSKKPAPKKKKHLNQAATNKFLKNLIAQHPPGSADPMPAAKKAAMLKRMNGK